MKLHLGCGKRYLEGYIHIDLAKFPHIDHYSGVDDLHMIKDGSITEIYASHVLEYFDILQVVNVLREWRRVLAENGELYLSVPCLDALIEIYHASNDVNKILGPLFGRMPLNDATIYHRIIYNRDLLVNVLEKCGFKNFSDWDTYQKFPDFDDHSKAFYPHMDPAGIQVSINISCQK